MIFVDTSAWFAVSVASDSDHASAAIWLAQNEEPLLTSDYVVDETLTLLRARGERTRAVRLGERLFAGNLAEIYLMTGEDIAAAWEVFREFADKEWSFTDCASKVVMERLGIGKAFAFDDHFRQFGSIAVVP